MISNFAAVMKNYVGFSGRASRREYWLFVLANVIIAVILTILSLIIGGGAAASAASGGSGVGLVGGALVIVIISSLYSLAIILPSLAVAVRRLHDIGKPGVWYLVTFIPMIGGIWLLVLLASEGNSGTNEFGEAPTN